MAISASGDGLVVVALPLLALSLTRNLVAIAGVTAANGISRAISAVPGGMLVDRCDHRRVMVACNFVSGVVLAALVAAMSLGTANLALVYVVAVALPISDTIWECAMQAYIPGITLPSDLATVNGRLQGIDVAGEQFLGPAVGGVLFGVARRLPFLGDAVSFLLSASLTSGLPRRPRVTPAGVPAVARRPGAPRHARPGWGSHLVEGFSVFRQLRTVQLLAVAVGWLVLCFNMVLCLLVFYGAHVLHLKAGGYGLFVAFAALLGALGAFGAGRLQARFGLSTLIVAGCVSAGVSYIALSFTRSVVLAVFVWGLQEVGITLANVGFAVIRQRLVPAHVFGRVLGIYRLITATAIPVGALLASFLADHWGVTTDMAVAGALELLALPVLLPPLLRRVRAELA